MRSPLLIKLILMPLGFLSVLLLGIGGASSLPTAEDDLIRETTLNDEESITPYVSLTTGDVPEQKSSTADLASSSDVVSEANGTALNAAETALPVSELQEAEEMYLADDHLSDEASSEAEEEVKYDVTDAHGPEFADAHASAADLRIRPRFNVGHTSSGGWMNGLSRISGWIPVSQQIGESVTFIEPRLVVDNEGNLGGNFLLGHREYDDDQERLWAGYLSVDVREAERGVCDQLGLGMETLGDKWDVHLNGYIPIGTCRKTLEENFFSTGGGVNSSANFVENELILSETQGAVRTFTDQVAVGGFDLGGTFELAEWDDGDGDLRAHAAIYHLGAIGIDDAFGWRLGLEARPVEQIVLGVMYQEDEMFGSNVMASITASLPRVRPKDDVLDEFERNFEVVERLGEPIRRNHTIVMNTISGREDDLIEIEEPLYNPQNGTDENPGAYRFIHVDLGAASNGDGTAENPYNNIDDALADASDNSGTVFGNPETAENQIVYVDASSSPDIDAFEIPAGVRVLSQAPTQLLNGSNDSFSTFDQVPGRLPFSPDNNFNTGTDDEEGIVVTLPGSGDGDFPVLDTGASNLIVMNSNTVLSGFEINNAPGSAVFADGAENVEIRDSFINNAGEQGIYLSEVSGSAILFDNEISGAGDEGIFIENATAGNNIEVTARRQTIDDARVGISVAVGGGSVTDGNSAQIVDIEDAVISDSAEQGLFLSSTQLGSQQVTFQPSDTGTASITNSGAEGVLIEAETVGTQEVIIDDVTISDNGAAGISVRGSIENGQDNDNTSAQEIFIRNSRITNNNGAGIDIVGNGNGAQEFGIDANIITGNAGDGIQAIANNVVFQEFVTDPDNEAAGVATNTITGNAGQGIDFDANDQATLLADISNNELSNTATANGDPELEITSNTNNADLCAYVFQNDASTGSILLDNNSNGNVQGLFEVFDLTGTLTLSSNTTATGTVTLLPNQAAFTERGTASSVADAEAGSCFVDED